MWLECEQPFVGGGALRDETKTTVDQFEGGLIREGGGGAQQKGEGLQHLAEMMVSVLHKELE